MKESAVVSRIERELESAGLYYVNHHGDMLAANGTPDFLTMDFDSRFTAIEAKAPGRSPYVNQWRRAIEILMSGGRFFVGYDDFDTGMLRSQDRFFEIGCEIGVSEFLADELFVDRDHTVEVILGGKDH